MKSISYDSFIINMGFQNNPFIVYTTERERNKEALFIEPSDFSSIVYNFEQRLTIIITGNRGTGKTAIIEKMKRDRTTADEIVCNIDDFSRIRTPNSNILDYYTILIRNISFVVFEKLVILNKRIKKLNIREKSILSMILTHYYDTYTQQELYDKISSVRIGVLRKTIRKVYGTFRKFFNNGASFVAPYILSSLALPVDPNLPQKELLPDLGNIGDDIRNIESSYQLLCELLKICKKLGFKPPTIFLDKIDEDARVKNDAQLIADFIQPLLQDNKLLVNEDIQMVISLWTVAYRYLIDSFRSQKLGISEIRWAKDDLVKVINKRLGVYSNNKIGDYLNIFSEDVDAEDIKLLFFMTNANPRDTWHLLNKTLDAQYQIDCNANLISKEALHRGIECFVTEFNFYEYYPKNANAKASTMDVYSYIRLLSKLSSSIFTKNQFNEETGAGSSTGNYVTNMERIGLIINSGEKRDGAVLYVVNDPKVHHAIRTGIEIKKVS